MSLREIQVFLTTYLRDQDFRARYRAGDVAELERKIGLSQDDSHLVRQIKLDHLDKIAENVLRERLSRTNAVFGLFLEHLGNYVEIADFYREFDRQFTRGWWQRRAEIRRFEAYAADFVIAAGLSDYLIDLCQFCAHVTTVAETPKVAAPANADLPGLAAVRANYIVALRQPFDVIRLRHDVVRILEDPDDYGARPLPLPTDVLIQRDWRQHKRSRIFTLRNEPVLRALAAGPVTVFELGALLPEVPYAALLTTVAGLYSDDIVHIVVPPELAGEISPAPLER
jgi:hypothetical protein